jgi:phosphoglycolate phosphatase
MRLKNIIFDLDGTLVDSFQDIFISLTTAAKHLGLPAPSKIMMTNNMHLRLDQLVGSMYPDTDRNALMQEFRDHYDGSGYLNTIPYPRVNETMQYLNEKGCRLFVATNKRNIAAKAIINRVNLNDSIEDIYTSDCADTVLTKEKLVQRLIVDKELDVKSTVLVGDTQSDWDAAIFNCLFFIYAAYGYGKLDHILINKSKTATIDSFSQLIRIIEKIRN